MTTFERCAVIDAERKDAERRAEAERQRIRDEAKRLAEIQHAENVRAEPTPCCYPPLVSYLRYVDTDLRAPGAVSAPLEPVVDNDQSLASQTRDQQHGRPGGVEPRFWLPQRWRRSAASSRPARSSPSAAATLRGAAYAPALGLPPSGDVMRRFAPDRCAPCG